MKLILRSDMRGLGKRGDIVDVSDGHARNYLLSKGLAIPASEGALNQATSMRRARDLRDAQDREAAQTVAKELVARTFTIKVKAGAEGRLFGSVTAADVAAAVEAQAKVALDRKKLHVEHVKALGTYQATARLHSEVEFPITFEVVAK